MEKVKKHTRSGALRTGVLILTVANLAVKVLGVADKVPLNALLGDEMANVNAACALYALLYTVSTAGIPSAVALSVSRARAAKDGARIKRLFDGTMTLLLAVGCLLSLLLLLLAHPISLMSTDGEGFLCTVAIAPALFFTAASAVLRGFFQGFSLLTPTAVSELFEALGKTLFGLALAFFSLQSLGKPAPVAAALAVFGITLGVLMGAAYLALFYKRHAPALLAPLDAPSPQKEGWGAIYRTLLVTALPLALCSALMSLSSLLDAGLMRPLLASYYGDEALAKALYSDYSTGALTLYNLPAVLITPLAAALIPYVSGAAARGEEERAKEITRATIKLAAVLSLPCAAGLLVLARPILSFVFGADVNMADHAGPSLSVLAVAVFLAAVLTVTTATLQAMGRARLPIFSLGVGVLCKLLSMSLLVSRFGTLGVPLSTVAFYAVSVLLKLVFLSRLRLLRLRPFDTFLRPLFCAAACGGMAYFSYRPLAPVLGSAAALLLAVLLGGVVYLLLLVLTRALNGREIALLPLGKRTRAILENVFKV